MLKQINRKIAKDTDQHVGSAKRTSKLNSGALQAHRQGKLVQAVRILGCKFRNFFSVFKDCITSITFNNIT